MKSTRIYISIIILLAATVACRMNVGGPSPSGQQIPISPEAASNLQQQFEQALQISGQNGKISLNISESQLTSLLAARLEKLPDPFITDPQVYLRDGEIQIYGKAARGYFEANISIILTPSIDQNGQPLIEISSANFGPIPVPENMTTTISSMVQEAYTGALGPLATGFKLDSIVVGDGVMTLNGTMQ